MKILFIEDHPYKLGQVMNFLVETFFGLEVVTRSSYNSGLRELVSKRDEYDLILLDISMPNYDISPEESGGDFLPMAGKLILKEMYLREISTKAIVVTMHGSYEDGTRLSDLNDKLRQEFPENYMGYVYFSAVNSDWKIELKKLIEKVSK